MTSTIPHGGGLRGRDGCPCDLCKEARRVYMRGYMQEYRAERRRSGKVRTREDVRVPHGGGAKGRKDCECEPCKVQYRKYVREGVARMRANRKKAEGN